MPEKCRKILSLIEDIAPTYLGETWDNIGLQIGDYNEEIKKVMVCLEVTDKIIDEAVSKNIDLIICHHPLIFKPLKAIRRDDVIGNMVYRLISHNISLYCAHTNLDIVQGGINDSLGEILDIQDMKPLAPIDKEKYFKLVVYVPNSHIEVVRNAICSGGAGHIGNYSHCTFQVEGIGTFKPLEGSTPFIGSHGELEKVSEYRLETIVEKKELNNTINRMLESHPYEEVAYDIFPLNNNIHRYGFGRVGKLKNPITLVEFSKEIKSKLNMKNIKFVGDPYKNIQKIGLCTGSGAEFINNAYEAGCDCYITGDIKYHDAQYAMHLGLAVIDAGHFETETIVGEFLYKNLNKGIMDKNYDVEIFLAATDINPFQTI